MKKLTMFTIISRTVDQKINILIKIKEDLKF